MKQKARGNSTPNQLTPRNASTASQERQPEMPKAFPHRFRRDVVAVARRREIPTHNIDHDFGISESCVHRWVKEADVVQSFQDGGTGTWAQLREVRKRNKTLVRRTTSCGGRAPGGIQYLLRYPTDYASRRPSQKPPSE